MNFKKFVLKVVPAIISIFKLGDFGFDNILIDEKSHVLLFEGHN